MGGELDSWVGVWNRAPGECTFSASRLSSSAARSAVRDFFKRSCSAWSLRSRAACWERVWTYSATFWRVFSFWGCEGRVSKNLFREIVRGQVEKLSNLILPPPSQFLFLPSFLLLYPLLRCLFHVLSLLLMAYCLNRGIFQKRETRLSTNLPFPNILSHHIPHFFLALFRFHILLLLLHNLFLESLRLAVYCCLLHEVGCDLILSRFIQTTVRAVLAGMGNIPPSAASTFLSRPSWPPTTCNTPGTIFRARLLRTWWCLRG